MAGLIALAFTALEVSRFLTLPPMSAAEAATATSAAIGALGISIFLLPTLYVWITATMTFSRRWNRRLDKI